MTAPRPGAGEHVVRLCRGAGLCLVFVASRRAGCDNRDFGAGFAGCVSVGPGVVAGCSRGDMQAWPAAVRGAGCSCRQGAW